MAGSRRNYKAMLDAKLTRSIAELEAGRGDAYERCVSKGGDPHVDLAIAMGEARDRGLNTGSAAPIRAPVRPAPAPPPTRESYAELIERIEGITGLNARQASMVAAEFRDGASPDKQQIIRRAETLGY